MASSLAKIGLKRPRKRQNNNYRFVPFRSYTTRNRKLKKKMAKKFKKLKNTIMASFQDKIGWKMQRKSENRNCRFVMFRSYPTRNRKFQKNSERIQKYHFGIISSQNRLENVEKERI